MSTTNLSSEHSQPTITTHATEQWEKRVRVDDAEPLATAIEDTFEVDSQVDGDTSFYHAEYDMLLVVKSWSVVTVLHADHNRMDTTSMQSCECGCLMDLFEHDACPRCEEPMDGAFTVRGGTF